MQLLRKSEIIEHMERGIQTEQNFSFEGAVKWARKSVDLLKAELPHETEAIEEIRRVFHLKKWHGAEYGCKVVNKVYENAIKEIKNANPANQQNKDPQNLGRMEKQRSE